MQNITLAANDNVAFATFASTPAYYRPGTTDENALVEVLITRAYSRLGFDVEAGEHWLDLGAHVGAFALLCASKGATATCYEPMPDNFALLRKNVPQFKCYQTAISNLHAPEVTFWTSHKPHNRYRGTLIPREGHPQVTVKNTHASALMGQTFSGIKCDVEGAEGALIDEWLFPKANKLCLELHLSLDNSLPNLVRRIRILEHCYRHVIYDEELAQLIKRGKGTGHTLFDPLIFCSGLRSSNANAPGRIAAAVA
jgi:FkbM family methyltransferase